MYRLISTVLLVACSSWLGWIFHRKSLALTNGGMLDLLSWAWHEHPQGVMLCITFALLWLCAFVFMLSIAQKVLAIALGKPATFVYAGDELLNRNRRYYREDDPARRILSLPASAGSELKFSFPTHLDAFFRREVYLVNGEDPQQFIRAEDYGLAPALAFSLFFYLSLGGCIAVLHALARDYMLIQARMVTPMDSVGEFLVVVPALLALNMVLLVVEYIACRIKLSRRNPARTPPVESLGLQAGDRVRARLVESRLLGNHARGSGVTGAQVAYYLVQFDSPAGVPLTAAFRFGYSRKQGAAVAAFVEKLAPGVELECIVSDRLTLLPAALVAAGVDWFGS